MHYLRPTRGDKVDLSIILIRLNKCIFELLIDFDLFAWRIASVNRGKHGY